MKSSSNAYRGTNHPDDLHKFLNRAILDQTEARGITKNSQLIPPNTLDLPQGELIMRWSIIQGRSGRKAAVLAIMRIGEGWVRPGPRGQGGRVLGQRNPPGTLQHAGRRETHRLKPGPTKKTSA